MNLGMSATDLKMVTSIVIVVFLGLGPLKTYGETAIFNKGGYLNAKN
jgi:ABC-type uncharacterized transport system permease subunit